MRLLCHELKGYDKRQSAPASIKVNSGARLVCGLAHARSNQTDLLIIRHKTVAFSLLNLFCPAGR